MLSCTLIIPTYNRRNDLRACLDSVFRMEKQPDEVIVVDSSSTDGTKELCGNYGVSHVTIQTRSMVVARNEGIRRAKFGVVAFVDDDAVLDRSWLQEVLECYSNERVGAVGGRVVDPADSKTHERSLPSPTGVVQPDGVVIGNFGAKPLAPIPVDFIMGCNMSFRLGMLKKIGGFDENYVGNCYREDTDICLRIKRAGYLVMFEPNAVVFHMYRGRRITDKWFYWYTRNHTYFYMKNIFPNNRVLLPIAILRILAPPRNYVRSSGIKPVLTTAALKGALAGLLQGFKTGLTRERVLLRQDRDVA